MVETLSEKETYEIISNFYTDCLKFWDKEVNERGFITELTIQELAIKDVEGIKHNPYSPKGKILNVEAKEKRLTEIKKTFI